MSTYVYYLLNYFFLLYGLVLISIYFGFVVLANRAIRKNKRRAVFLEGNDIVSATDIPTVTLIAPAFNEGQTILMNVKSLLSIQYPYFDLVVVNDGSTDDSVEKLIEAYDLEEVDSSFITQPIPTATVNRIFKSRKSHYRNLTLIDKNNGGRADALNAGINFSDTELVLCTDADCIIEQDALLKMVRPFLEENDTEIIGCGGGIGIVNDSVIQNGTLKKLRLPRGLVPTIQVVEYIRAFLLGRMAWSEINGLLLVSGAFGLYRRKRLVEIGGLDTVTVGEDFELCVRLRIHMEDLNIPHKVVYIPETLCWTECPDSYQIFVKQRDRWARGLWETVERHKKLFFNRNYKKMGLFYFPYWCFFELGAPMVEFLGLVFIIVFGFLGWINWPVAMLLFSFVYLVGCIFSTVAIFTYVRNFKHYNNPREIVELLLAAYLEPFLFHPILLYAQIKGYGKKIFKIRSGWGTMTRKGFSTTE